MLYNVLIVCTVFLGILGCADQSVDKYKVRAEAEQEGSNKAENDNLAKLAVKMEQDLTKRHLFYASIEGEYEGTMQANNENYHIKFTFVRSIPPYTDDRVRQLSEIENDLNNLYFHMQVVQWHPDDLGTAVGCRVSGIRPNMDEGTLTVASTECPNLYSIFLSEGGNSAFNEKLLKAESVAQKVKSLLIKDVPFLIGTVQPSSNASKYSFSVKKLN